ncbi:MAG: extracellular solute-binding protein, partial [Spirochaetales bacterium]|nr:extracellular solute-binding protein [Spirochaetales bacterium]
AIMTFINWMTNTENNLDWSKETGYMPLRESVVDSPAFKRYLAEEPESKVAVDQISYTRPRPSIAAYGDISRVIGGAVEAALVAGMDPAEVLNAAVPEANNVLDDWEERLK